MSIISFLIRQFVLPNPFVNMFDLSTATVVNWIFGGVFIPLAYLKTGIWYRREWKLYWLGSLGFLINYTILTYLLIGISSIVTNIWLIACFFIIAYIILCAIVYKIVTLNSSCLRNI